MMLVRYGKTEIPPGMPPYWMRQPDSPLYRAMWKYLDGNEPLSSADVALIRGYLIGVIDAPIWAGRSVGELRARARSIDTPSAISVWLYHAENAGIDPI